MAAEEKSLSVQEQASASESEKMNCKFCKKEVFKTKIVMHITRNKDCKEYYGSELDAIRKIQNAEGKKKSNEKYYQNNSENIKESYDPAERRIKYLTEKKNEKNIKVKIQRNGSEISAKNEVVKTFIERQDHSKLYKANWYKKNSEEIKKKNAESSDKRRSEYLMRKKIDKMKVKKLQTTDFDILAKDKGIQNLLKKKEDKKLYSSRWYKNNSEKVKKKQAESYDPDKRRAKYLKAKELDDKIEKRIAERNDSDDLAEDKEVQKLHERHERKRSSMAKWYKKNSEKIKENRAKSNDSEQKKVRYQKEKEINKNISSRTHDSDEDPENLSENDFVQEREYKKKWYKDNSERIKKKQAESYDPVERRKKYEVKKLNKAKLIKKVHELDSDNVADDEECCDFLNKHQAEISYKKNWYKEHSEKIRKKQTESYDPSKRNKKYQEEKKVKSYLIKKICEKDHKELAEDKDVCIFLNKDKAEISYKKNWYKENSEKIRKKQTESYDPSKRNKKYHEEKKVKSDLSKKICEKDHKELADDKVVCRFLNKDAKEKLYKKEWYKKNSEKIKKRKAKAYDPAKREKQYKKFKRKEEEYEAAERKKRAKEYCSSFNKDLENESRNENKTRREEANISNCASCKPIIDLNLPEMSDVKKQVEKEIEDLYCKYELEIDEIVQKGQSLDSLASHKPLYLKLYQKHPPPYGSKLIKI